MVSEDEQRIYDWLIREARNTNDDLKYYSDPEDMEWAWHYARVCENISGQLKDGEHRK